MKLYNKEVKEIVRLINKEDDLINKSIKKNSKEIILTINKCLDTLYKNGRIIYIGAGTSGKVAMLDSSEIPANFGEDLIDKFITLIAGGKESLFSPFATTEDNKNLVIEDLKKINFSKNDLIIGISASGSTPYVLSGIEYANKIGSTTISITNTKSTSPIQEKSDISINSYVGEEIIYGSTRMKAATCQKIILNTISTTTMIKFGRVYNQMMINVKISNDKLYKRAIDIIMDITKEEKDKVCETLKISNNNVPISIIMIKYNVGKKEAEKIFKQNNWIKEL